MMVNQYKGLDVYPLLMLADIVSKISQDKFYSSLYVRSVYYEVHL